MTNSRPHRGVDLRREYHAANPTCELWRWMEGESWDRVKRGWPRRDYANVVGSVHHVWSDGQRYDVRDNLVTVCEPVHAWIHQCLPMGRVLAVWVKRRKGEFDADVMRGVIGRCPLGALDLYEDESFEPWAMVLKELLLKEMF